MYEMNFYNEDEKIMIEVENDGEVLENYYRLKCAEVIEQGR